MYNNFISYELNNKWVVEGSDGDIKGVFNDQEKAEDHIIYIKYMIVRNNRGFHYTGRQSIIEEYNRMNYN